MKCPLLSIEQTREIGLRSEILEDCLKEGCAWWDLTAMKCAVLQLAFEIDKVYGELERLADQMPPAKE